MPFLNETGVEIPVATELPDPGTIPIAGDMPTNDGTPNESDELVPLRVGKPTPLPAGSANVNPRPVPIGRALKL
jgi:hypothetical protein